MTPIEFLRAVWPGGGHYCLATPYRPPGTEKSVWAHSVFDSIEDAANFAEKNKQRTDIFFAVHSLHAPRVWNPKKENRKTGEPGNWEYRTHANMHEARCFFLDLDVGESGKKYPSQRSALEGLIQFCQATSLPRPLIVSSGRGLHVYWVLADPLPSLAWKTYATKLKRLADHHALRYDPARITDQASVLRVAGTFHHKDPNNPKLVRVLSSGQVSANGQFFRLLEDVCVQADVSTPFLFGDLSGAPTGLGNNLKREFTAKPPTMRALLTVCSQIGRLALHPEEATEPQWYQALNVVRFVEDGHAFAHKFSRGHPNYSAEETDKKLGQQVAKECGPTSCAKIAEVCGEERCKLCPFLGHVISPVTAARRWLDQQPNPAPDVTELVGTVIQPLTVPPAPPGFDRTPAGITRKATDNQDDPWDVIIYDYDLYPLRIVANSVKETLQQVWRVHLPLREPKDFVLDAKSLYDRGTFCDTIANHGIYPKANCLSLLQDYMIAYIKELQKLTRDEVQHTHLGWTNECKSFVLPGRTFHDDGRVTRAHLDKNAASAGEHIQSKGTLERQIELMKFYNHPEYVAQQFYIMASLAAPIFFLTGQNGVILHAVGETGSAKSSALYAAASFWGIPELYTVNGTVAGATQRYRSEKASIISNLPVCVDDICHDHIEARELAMNVTQPAPRKRLEPDGSIKKTAEIKKSTVMLTTSNVSLYGLLAHKNPTGTAGSMRVVELVWKPAELIGVHKKLQADRWLEEIYENYGHIGPLAVAYAVKNLPAVKDHVRSVSADIDLAGRITPAERFWAALITATLTMGEIAYAHGWLPFDIAAVREWVLRQQIPLWRNTVSTQHSTPVGVLTNYLAAINGHTLVLREPQPGHNIPHYLAEPKGELVARHEEDKKLMWILKKHFRDYCIQAGESFLSIIQHLQRAGIVLDSDARKSLGAWCPAYETGRAWCIMIKMDHPEIAGAVKLEAVKSTPVPKLITPVSTKT